MKKYLIAFFAFVPFFSFGYLSSSDFTTIHRVSIYSYSSPTSSNVVYHSQGNLTPDTVHIPFYSSVVGVRFTSSTSIVRVPSLALYESNNVPHTANINQPISGNTIFNSLIMNYPVSPFPRVSSLFALIPNLYKAGYRGSGFRDIFEGLTPSRDGDVIVNFYYPDLIADILVSTNTVFHSLLFSSLASVNSSINNIRVDLGQFQTDYQTVNFGVLNISNFIDSAAAQNLITSYQADLYKNDIASAYSDPDTWGDPSSFARSVYDNIESIKNTLNQANALNSNPDLLNDFAKQFGDSFSAAGAGHYTTPLTNEMKRLSTDWVNETKAALSNNTQKIKDDLSAWKNQLHGTQTSIDNSAANIYNTLNNIAGGSAVVHVNVENRDIGVTITDPVTIDPTQFNSFSEDLGKAGQYMERLYNEFKYWAWTSPDGWKTGFLDSFLDSLIPKVEEEVSLQHSISNLLADFAFNFTNNTEFAISNALAGFTFSSTNDYILLTDYADYINTSGLSDLLGFMDDDAYSDLKDELSSIGSDDVSEGYGRWWRYYTGLSTIQANSVFKIANLLLDHEKLLKDLKRDNTDVVELSDSNVFAELLSKIPSQTHIDNKISELTNSIDQSGFVRIRELIPDLTNRLSVASALYDHDFALPTDISWVLIPADSDLNIKERVVHISPSEHYRVFQVLHYGIAFSYCIVNLILLPKFLLLLVRLFDRVWNKSEHLIYNSTQS